MPKNFTQEAVHSLEAKLIHSLLEGPKDVQSRILAEAKPEDFITDTAREVFRRVRALVTHGRDIPRKHILLADPVLSDEAKVLLKRNVEPITDRTDLDLLLDGFHTISRSEKALSRLADVAEALKNRDISRATSLLSDVARTLQGDESESLVLDGSVGNIKRVLEVLDSAISGEALHLVKTGLSEFDEKSGGLPRGGVTLICATTGGGKTTLALNMAVNQAKMGYRVLYASLEMSEEELLMRITSRLSRIPFEKLYKADLTPKARIVALRKLSKFLREIKQKGGCLELLAPSSDRVSIDDICAYARGKEFDVIYIDYVGLLRDLSSAKAKWENLSDAVRNAKLFASVVKRKPAMVILAQYDMKKDQVRYSRAMVEHSSLTWAWVYGDVERSTNRVKVRQIKTRNQPQYDFWLQANFNFCEMRSVSQTVEEPSTVEEEPPDPDEPKAIEELDQWVERMVADV